MASGLDRINLFLEGVTRNKRDIATPEGVQLEIDIANNGERLTAFALDFFFWSLATALLFLILVLLLVERINGAVSITIVLFLSFLLRNLYFIHFELTTQGSTPGKRIVGLRVIDRNGGPLRPGAIIARNLTREVEIFLPLGLLAQLSETSGQSAWMVLAYLGWILVIAGLPLFNRNHMRAGDLIAGTIVISVPRRVLLKDLASAAAPYAFSHRQLEAYGTFELQVLEELLRRPDSVESQVLWRDVCAKICRKIGWTSEIPASNTRQFLTAFYSAERAYLEREQLFGKFRADKTSGVSRNPQGTDAH
jgi:uncharacterized RDD family membrane protein YckC